MGNFGYKSDIFRELAKDYYCAAKQRQLEGEKMLKQVTYQLNDEILEWLKNQAEKRDITPNDVLRILISNEMAREKLISETKPTKSHLEAFAVIEQDFYCAAKHLHSFLEDAKYERVADFGLSCSDCKYNIGGADCDMYGYLRFQRLGNITGITFDAKKRSRQ